MNAQNQQIENAPIVVKNIQTLYLKLTNACSLRCKHCYITNYNAEHKLIRAILDESFFQQYQFPNIKSVIFHGGEATELGFEIFSHLVLALAKHYPRLKFKITSNLITTPQNVLLALAKAHFEVATSYDVDVRFKRQKNIEIWKKNINFLTQNNVLVSVLSVLTNPFINHFNSKQKLIEFFNFLESLSINAYRIERYINTDFIRDDFKPTNKQEAEFAILLIDAYYEYLKTTKRPVLLYSLQDIVENLEKQKIGQPFVCKGCDHASSIIFEPEYEYITLCSKLMNYYRFEAKHHINYFYNKYSIIQSMKDLELAADESCKTCEYSQYCMKQVETCLYHIMLDGSLVDASQECSYGKTFHKWFSQNKHMYNEFVERMPKPFLYMHTQHLLKEEPSDHSWYFT